LAAKVTALELLAPAGNKDIGIAAINCGADAVYMAGPVFGARKAAGNSIQDVAETCSYAHRYGAKVYLTVNTILYDSELEDARRLIIDGCEAGCDAIIVQDLGILEMDIPPVPIFASTQCNIRSAGQARFLEALGFSRLILARELSLEQIREIRRAVKCDLESFVHGALCVSYSGRCYLSCHLTGRSANRGECIQACRSRYDVEDSQGRVIMRNRAVLSLKDLDLSDRLGNLVDAGVTSFKIEGRLKNASYVKNVVRLYRTGLDSILSRHCTKYARASAGHLYGGFTSSVDATFTRGSTDFFIDGRRGGWSSMETAKGIGEYVGTVSRILEAGQSMKLTVSTEKNNLPFSNGDGLCFISDKGEVCGMRVEIAEGNNLTVRRMSGITSETKLYRNYNAAFERELERNIPTRLIGVRVMLADDWSFRAVTEDGAEAVVKVEGEVQAAVNREKAEESILRQLNKKTEPYLFSVVSMPEGVLPFMPVSQLNGVRRELAAELDRVRSVVNTETASSLKGSGKPLPPVAGEPLNCANALSRRVYERVGLSPEPAFELSRDTSGEYRELMRTKYCLRYELGLCPKMGGRCHTELLVPADRISPGPLFLVNNGHRLRLTNDCVHCENVLGL